MCTCVAVVPGCLSSLGASTVIVGGRGTSLARGGLATGLARWEAWEGWRMDMKDSIIR